MAEIVTRISKGTALTHAEMDQNLENLNAEIASNQSAALVSLQGIPEAQFMAMAAANRKRYASSGDVYTGKHYSSAQGIINDGLWTYSANSDYANSLMWGRSTSAAIGTSETDWPVLNIHGFEMEIRGITHDPAYVCYQNMFLFPPAPASSAMLERQDLALFELHHEKIAEKDFVYPLGLLQSQLSVDPSTGLTTVYGSFPGSDTYSLFSEDWQTPGDMVGRGLVWSSMSDANKQKFASERKNRMYRAEDGSWIQVRGRIRVIKGLGASWNNLAPNTGSPLRYLQNSPYCNVIPKGRKTSIGNDLNDGTVVGQWYVDESNTNAAITEKTTGAFKLRNTGESESYKDLCFAYPIACVSPRNQGTWHNVFNENGTTWAIWNNGAAGGPWYDNTSAITSVEDCFDFYNGTTNPTGSAAVPYKGTIADPSQIGRPDGLASNAIYEGDVEDLRTSANGQELARTLEREVNRLVAGETRGWEGSAHTVVETGVVEIRTNLGTASTFQIGDYSNYSTGDRVAVFSTTNNTLVVAGYVGTISSSGFASVYPTYGKAFGEDAGSRTTFVRINGDTYTIFIAKRNLLAKKTLLQCDILGDPSNYPSEWFTNGVMGTPLIVGENGEDLRPDLTSKFYKMSRKAKGAPVLVLNSQDGGNTWTDGTNDVAGIWSSSGNGWQGIDSANTILLVFYLADANPFEVANNSEVLKLGEVEAINYCDYHPKLVQGLIGKVPVNAGTWPCDEIIPVSSYQLSASTQQLSTNVPMCPKHGTIRLGNSSSPTVKILSYLTRENGKLYLQMLFKEMVYDSGMDSVGEFTAKDASTSQTYAAGEIYKITNIITGYYLTMKCVTGGTYTITSTCVYDGTNLRSLAGILYFEPWDGNGWADDNKFNVIDGVSSTTDDNGNTVLFGQKRIELPYFVEDAA